MYLFYMKPKILENTCRIITFILLIQLNAFDIIVAITNNTIEHHYHVLFINFQSLSYNYTWFYNIRR